jgi:phosphoribosyl 1,2-cyclic phosphodiesterase
MLDVPIFANQKTWEAMEDQLGNLAVDNKRYFNTGEKFCIGDICVHPFAIPHDANEPVGFNFFAKNKKITVATDIGHVTKELYDNVVGSDFMLIEANHDIEMVRMGPYPWYLKQRILGENGHLSNTMAGKFIAKLVESGTKNFLLGHLSRENNFPQLAFETVKNVLESKGIKSGVDVNFDVAMRDCVGEVICVV